MQRFVDGQFDRVVLFYNKFKNAAVQITTEEQYLPIPPAPRGEGREVSQGEHIMEPDRATIVEQIIPKSLKIQLYKALLDSFAAEHGARMTAMHKATDNADALLKDLKLTYNKARQASITNEILEIVGGAEALKN
jgi:F-type H+-transporting ATPase subunit gamma